MWDPLGHSEPLLIRERFFPGGFPLILRTNSDDVVAAARYGWADFAAAFDTEPIEIRVSVRGEGAAPAPEGPSVRAQGHLIVSVLDRDNFVVCDLDRCFCFITLTAAVARDPIYTSFHFLDSAAYCCLTHRDVTPIHAACVAWNGRGVLLVGEPRTGKSLLAWACAQAGLSYVADDATWLLRNSSDPCLIGKPQRMRFRPSAVELIPELAGLTRLETVAGKESFEIRTADVPGLPTAACCRPWRILFLERRPEGPAALVPVGEHEAHTRLSLARAFWEPRVWDEQEDSIERLLKRCPAQILRYSTLAGAVEQILKLE